MHPIPNGMWKQNCYIVVNFLNEAIIIDPGSEGEKIGAAIADLAVKPLAILNTHAHYDHIGAVDYLAKKYAIPFYLHTGDEKLLKQANLFKILFESTNSILIPKIDIPIETIGRNKNGIDGFDVSIIETPGHTNGGVCILLGKLMFSGDTLLPNGPATTNLPGGSAEKLVESLNLLKKLPGDILVYPGHGKPFFLLDFWKKYGEI